MELVNAEVSSAVLVSVVVIVSSGSMGEVSWWRIVWVIMDGSCQGSGTGLEALFMFVRGLGILDVHQK